MQSKENTYGNILICLETWNLVNDKFMKKISKNKTKHWPLLIEFQ